MPLPRPDSLLAVQKRPGLLVRALIHRDLHKPLEQYPELNGAVVALGSVTQGRLPNSVAAAVHTNFQHARREMHFPVAKFKAMVPAPVQQLPAGRILLPRLENIFAAPGGREDGLMRMLDDHVWPRQTPDHVQNPQMPDSNTIVCPSGHIKQRIQTFAAFS